MERLSVDYKMEQFTPEELDKFLIANGIRYDGYIYGMTQNQIIQSHAHLQQVLNQYQRAIGEVYNFVEEAMKYALTC